MTKPLYEIEFFLDPTAPNVTTRRFVMAGMTDSAIDKAKAKAELIYGRLPKDPKTDFPSFSVYEDGEEIAGG